MQLLVTRDLMSHMAQVKETFLGIICCYVDLEAKRKHTQKIHNFKGHLDMNNGESHLN